MTDKSCSGSESDQRYEGDGGEQLRRVLHLIGPRSPVLDIGCGRGNLARVCDSPCDGVEADSGRASVAERWCRRVFKGAIEDNRVREELRGRTYGAVAFVDTLEHILDAREVLEFAGELLADDGVVVVAAPNVAHYTRRVALALGDWTYTDEGLMDRTHVWFFTLGSLYDLIGGAGFVVKEASVVCAMPRGLRFLEGKMESWAPTLFGRHVVVSAAPGFGPG